MEIYNETVRDLLSPETEDLRIHEDKRVFIFDFLFIIFFILIIFKYIFKYLSLLS
jgi:hypothetical protein